MGLPYVGVGPDFHSMCESRNLQAIQSDAAGMWELSSKLCLGLSEVDIINGVIEGCAQLLEMDSSVAATKAESISRPQTILPGLGEGHYPGFPTADCPETMPKLSK